MSIVFNLFGLYGNAVRLVCSYRNRVVLTLFSGISSFYTMPYDAGIDLKITRRWMGHTDEKMILRLYAYLTDRQEQRATEKLRAYLAGRKHIR